MNICLIGNNLTNLVLAKNLLDRKINIDLFCHPTINSTKTTRTIGISENNIRRLKLLYIKGFGGISAFKKKPALKKAGFYKF